MKKFFTTLKFLSKAALLIFFLILGWLFINATNLVKGKKVHEKDLAWNPLDIEGANADTPPGGGGGGGGPIPACPQVAYFDGSQFRIENDFLPGEFKNIRADFPFLRQVLKQHSGHPDLLKFSGIPRRRKGKLALRLEEIEPEESFINRIKFIRLLHPKNSEVMVDAAKRKPLVVDQKLVRDAVVLPGRAFLNGKNDITGLFQDKNRLWESPAVSGKNLFERDDFIELTFHGLKPGETAFLIVQSAFRDWFAGDAAPALSFQSIIAERSLMRTFAVVSGIIALSFRQDHLAQSLASLPLIFLVQGKSIRFSYLAPSGEFIALAIQKPRAFRHTTEYITCPQEAVREDGTLVIRADFTERHQLAFAGVVQRLQPLAFREEALPLEQAIHSRKGEVSEEISGNGAEVHMIPGDIIDLEFAEPQLRQRKNEKETYLMESQGFYTKLRPEYKRIAGEWTEKLSPEAKRHYQTLAALSKE